MRKKIRYQATTDLRLLREVQRLSKEEVADKLSCSVRTLERREKENAVFYEEEVQVLSKLYDKDELELFYEDISLDKLENFLRRGGKKPENKIDINNEYYLIYIVRRWIVDCCIYGETDYVGRYSYIGERRILRAANIEMTIREWKHISIINDEAELKYWYYSCAFNRAYPVLISGKCLQTCLSKCMEEKIVSWRELLEFDMAGDITFLGNEIPTFTSLT